MKLITTNWYFCSSMRYKEEYERFKLTVTVIILILSAQSILFSYRWVSILCLYICISIWPLFYLFLCVLVYKQNYIGFTLFLYRFLDALLHFLLVWYYCTLTIRESILVINGSRYVCCFNLFILNSSVTFRITKVENQLMKNDEQIFENRNI